MMNDRKEQVVLIGTAEENQTLIQAMKLLDYIEIAAIVDPKASRDTEIIGNNRRVPVYPDVYSALQKDAVRYSIVIDTVGSEDVLKHHAELQQQGAAVFDPSHKLLYKPLMQKLLEADKQRRWSEAVMEAAQEGIQVVDGEGKILYANAAFTRILNVPVENRIGKNVFDVSPDGSLAYVLRTGKAVFGNTHITNGIPIIANASPLIDDGKLVGAVTVFNDASSIEKMAQIVQKNKEEIDSLRAEIHKMNRPKYTFLDLVGENTVFQNCVRQAKQAADSNSTVLITGESGTGKELFAHSIHEFGQRGKGPFIKVNCPAIPGTLLESELFGYEKGAFTGAAKSKIGKFELAHGGTIFLDEIGDLDMVLQAKLLRVLQEREVERVGGSHPIQVDVRVIAATNQNLQELIDKGLFRKDLYYRLNVIHIHVPPLRERSEDISLIAEQMLHKLYENNLKNRISFGKGFAEKRAVPDTGAVPMENQPPKLDRFAIQELRNYSWPGNVRELENLMEKLMLFSDCRIITREDVVYGLYADEKVQLNEVCCQSLAMMEKRMIMASLERHGNTLSGKKAAAKELGISLTCLYDKLKKYRMDA